MSRLDMQCCTTVRNRFPYGVCVAAHIPDQSTIEKDRFSSLRWTIGFIVPWYERLDSYKAASPFQPSKTGAAPSH
jgi:hypothetical protein